MDSTQELRRLLKKLKLTQRVFFAGGSVFVTAIALYTHSFDTELWYVIPAGVAGFFLIVGGITVLSRAGSRRSLEQALSVAPLLAFHEGRCGYVVFTDTGVFIEKEMFFVPVSGSLSRLVALTYEPRDHQITITIDRANAEADRSQTDHHLILPPEIGPDEVQNLVTKMNPFFRL